MQTYKNIIEFKHDHHAKKISIIQIPNNIDLNKIHKMTLQMGGIDMYELQFIIVRCLSKITIINNEYNIDVNDIMNNFIHYYLDSNIDIKMNTNHCIPFEALCYHAVKLILEAEITFDYNIVYYNEDYDIDKRLFLIKNTNKFQTCKFNTIKYNDNIFIISKCGCAECIPLGFFITTSSMIKNITITNGTQPIIKYYREDLERDENLLNIKINWSNEWSHAHETLLLKLLKYKIPLELVRIVCDYCIDINNLATFLYWIPINVSKWNSTHQKNIKFNNFNDCHIKLETYNNVYYGICSIKYRDILITNDGMCCRWNCN